MPIYDSGGNGNYGGVTMNGVVILAAQALSTSSGVAAGSGQTQVQRVARAVASMPGHRAGRARWRRIIW
jgi:hypothetical protein